MPIPAYVKTLCKELDGKPVQFKEYPKKGTVNVILDNGKKYTFPLPTRAAPSGAGKKKPAPKRRGKESDGQG